MHYFRYRHNRLHCESVDIERIARSVGTPFYLYSHKTLIDHYTKIRSAFRSMRPLICFSMKSNSNLAVCKALINEGAGLDIVSGGELFKARKIGADPAKIVYASVGKTGDEIADALKAGILFFNVESRPELVSIDSLCRRYRRRANIAVRVNPNVDAHTHRYITTGTQQNKFGIDTETVFDIFDTKDDFKNLNIIGLHIHIGSQITEPGPFLKAIDVMAQLIKKLRSTGHRIDHLNIGGGLGIVYHDERPQTAQQFADAVMPKLKRLNVRLILEPGRFISGNSGILVTKVLYIKETPKKNFIIVDAGMNDLMRPSLYEAYHEIAPTRRYAVRKKHLFDVVGPICESGDFLAKSRRLQAVNAQEYLAVMGAGAYGFSMSSNYNARPRVAEVMVINGRYYVTRARQTYGDLIRGEKIPGVLR